MKRTILAALAALAIGGAHAQSINEELDECMRNPISRWCRTMQQQDRDYSNEQNQRLQAGRRAQMCAIDRRYCYGE